MQPQGTVRFIATHPNTAEFPEPGSMAMRNARRNRFEVAVEADQHAVLLLGNGRNNHVCRTGRHVVPDKFGLMALLNQHIGHINRNVFI
jgi:hypothetical protein